MSPPSSAEATVSRNPEALRPALDRLVDDLDQHGLDSQTLRALRDELGEVEQPPGFFSRMRRKVADTLRRNWGHVVGEVRESRELVGVLKRAVTQGRSTLTDEEKADARAQIADLMRMAPASAVFLALEAIPIPGTAVLTPWVLMRTGLLPSRWREEHLLHGLRAEAQRLRDGHHDAEAADVDRVADALEAGCRQREKAAHDAALLTHWDFDGNGRWDPDESLAYDQAVGGLARLARKDGPKRRWFLQSHGHVFGPFPLSELLRLDTDVDLLVCHEGQTAWVDLTDLQSRLAPGDARPAP